MNVKKLYLLIGIVLIVGFLPQGNVSADMGPKPSMDFEFVQEMPGEILTMASWVLRFCKDEDCIDGYISDYPVLKCENNSCSVGGNFIAYDANQEIYQLEIVFSDGVTRKSNSFKRTYFDAIYKVVIRSEELAVKELRGSNINYNMFALVFIGGFLFYPATILVVLITSIAIVASDVKKKIGWREVFRHLGKVIFWALIVDFAFTGLVLSAITFVLNLAIEATLALAYWWYLKLLDKQLLYGVLLANIFTQPLFVLLQADLGLGIHLYSMNSILIAETVVWLIETLIIFFAQKKELSFIRILVLTFVLNAASFGIGLLLPI